MNKRFQLTPLFDRLENINDIPDAVVVYLASIKRIEAKKEYAFCIEFLKAYTKSKDTYCAYRREIERLFHWAYLIKKKPLIEMNRNDMRDYLNFIQDPPKSWIGIKPVSRYVIDPDDNRIPNPAWRPFQACISKAATRLGKKPNKMEYRLSTKSLQAVFAIVQSFYTYLNEEEYADINPMKLVRNKRSYFQYKQNNKVTRKFSKFQWITIITTAKSMAYNNRYHIRTYFILCAFYLLGIRISELGSTKKHPIRMSNFAPDSDGNWWYTTIGKGNKLRDVAVSDELLTIFRDYRVSYGLPPLPSRDESFPLLPAISKKTGIGKGMIRFLIQQVFDEAVSKLLLANKKNEADDLTQATVHWLRHTAISSDIEFRPREHIRDDVGHKSCATMDLYIHVDKVERHKSAKCKKLFPDINETVVNKHSPHSSQFK